MYGVQCRPSFARVWKDDAISSGETSLDPSVIEGTGRSGEVTPMSWAASTIAAGPTFNASWANTTLTECSVASHRSILPPPPGSAFCTQWHALSHCGSRSGDFDSKVDFGEMSSRNAATSVNGLNDDPVWRLAAARLNWSRS